MLDPLNGAGARVVNAAGQEAAAEDEENVGEDAAQHAGLDDADFAIAEGNDTHLRLG